jgi:hypothetical protein
MIEAQKRDDNGRRRHDDRENPRAHEY